MTTTRTIVHSYSLLFRDAVTYECAACGAAVSDIHTHRQWHREVEAVTNPAGVPPAPPAKPWWKRVLS
jgi:hypothetical protein